MLGGFQRFGRHAGVSMLALLAGLSAQANEADDSGSLIQEVVVTAQLRKQSAEDVPIAMQVVGAEQIEAVGATDIHDLQTFVPGLTVTGSQTEPHFSLRGIRSNDFGVGTDPAVGLYIDGIYSSRSGASITAFDDVEQIEVLKGPQGTLLGRNSPAGAISITTNKPTDKYEGQVTLRVGDYGDRRLAGMVNIPLTDTLDLRASTVLYGTNGYFKDAANGTNLEKQSEWTGKLALRWTPDALTDAIVTWRHDTLNGAPPASVNISPVVAQSTPAISFLYPNARPVYPYNPATLTDPANTPFTSDLIDGHQKRHLDDFTLSLTRDLGFATLTSLSNYRYFRTDNNESEDGTNVPYLYLATDAKEKNRQLYQEIKLNHADANFDWVAGASYYREMADQERYVEGNTATLDVAAANTQGVAPFYTIDKLLSGAGFGLPYTKFESQDWTESTINNGAHNSAYAAFADVIWHAMDRVDLTAGVRFTHDSKDYSWAVPKRYSPGIDAAIASFGGQAALSQILTQVLQGAGYPAPVAAGTAGALVAATQNNFAYSTQAAYGRYFQESNSWNNISPRVVADYELAKHMHVYASFSEGYKAGGFNSQQPPTPATGLAGADAFSPEKMYNYELGAKTLFPEMGLQVNAALFHYKYNNRQNIEFVQPCGTCIDEYVTQTEDDQANGLDLDLLYMPIENLQFGFNGSYIDATVAQPGVTLPGEVPIVKGQPTGEPSFSFIFSVAYTVNLTDSDSLRFDLNHAFRGETRCNNHTYSTTVISSCNEPLPFSTIKEENTTDLRATFLTERGKYKISAFVNNLFDNRWTTYTGGDGVDTLGTPTAEISAPRTFGIDLTAKF